MGWQREAVVLGRWWRDGVAVVAPAPGGWQRDRVAVVAPSLGGWQRDGVAGGAAGGSLHLKCLDRTQVPKEGL